MTAPAATAPASAAPGRHESKKPDEEFLLSPGPHLNLLIES
jgi:hypothetical protein